MNTIYDLANARKEQIMENAMITAFAVAAIQGSKTDDITEYKALKRFDRGWFKDRESRGLIKFRRKGGKKQSPKIYSLFEIISLQIAEKGLQNEFDAAQAEANKVAEQFKINSSRV